MTANLNKAQLLEISRLLLRYRAQFPHSTIESPQFAMYGTQSSGKTSMTAVVSGRLIGGSIKASAGTRCNIVYIFKNGTVDKYEIGTDLTKLEEVPLMEVSKRITQHNDLIATVPPGFDTSNYYVRVTSPDTADFSIIDKPGLIPNEADLANEHISNVLQLELKSDNLIPLIMVAPHTSMDTIHIDTPFNQIFKAVGNNIHAMRKAFVIFTQLDMFSNASADRFEETRDFVKKRFKKQFNFDLSDERIFFVSLKPFHLEAHSKTTSYSADHKDFNFIHENELVKNSKVYEGQFLPDFLKRIFGEDRGARQNLNFGVEKLMRVLEKEVLSNLERNNHNIIKQMKKDGDTLIAQVKATIKPNRDYDQILNAVDSYVDLVCEGLKATSVTDDQHFMEALKRANDSGFIKGYPSVKLVESLRMTFEESLREAENSLKNIPFGSAEVIDKIDKNSTLYSSLNDRYSGSIDVQRVLNMFKFYVMTTDLKYHDAADIYNKMELVGPAKADPSINVAIQKMVRESLEHFPTNDVVSWTTDIYTRIMPRVLAFLSDPKIFVQLAEYPKLLNHINEELELTYRNYFDAITKKASDSIEMIKAVHFATLGISKMESMVQLLGTSNIKALKHLVQPLSNLLEVEQKYQMQAYFAKNGSNKAADGEAADGLTDVSTESEENVANNVKKSRYRQTLDWLLGETDSERPNTDHGHTFEVIDRIAKCSVESFAIGDVIKLLQFGNIDDVRRGEQEINYASHAVSRLSIGIATLELIEIVKSNIVIPAQHVDNRIRSELRTVSQHLREKNNEKLINMLDDDNTRLRMIQHDIDQVQLWLSIAQPININSRDLTNTITKLISLKEQLEAKKAEEIARIAAKDSATSDEEDMEMSEEETTTAPSTSYAGKAEYNRVVLQNSNLRETILKRDRQIEILIEDLKSAKAVAAAVQLEKDTASKELLEAQAMKDAALKAEADAKKAEAAANKVQQEYKKLMSEAKKNVEPVA